MSVDQNGHFTNQAYFNGPRRTSKRSLFVNNNNNSDSGDDEISLKQLKTSVKNNEQIKDKIDQVLAFETVVRAKFVELDKVLQSHKKLFANKGEISFLNIVMQDIGRKIVDKAEFTELKTSLEKLNSDFKSINNDFTHSELKRFSAELKKASDFVNNFGLEIGKNQIKIKFRSLREVKNGVYESDAVNLSQLNKQTEYINSLFEEQKLVLASHEHLINRSLLVLPTDLNTFVANNRRITNLAAPTSSTDGVNLEYMRKFVRKAIEDLEKRFVVLLSEKTDKKNG
jgi:Coiled stalk of trimeric autotransporter adhesin